MGYDEVRLNYSRQATQDQNSQGAFPPPFHGRFPTARIRIIFRFVSRRSFTEANLAFVAVDCCRNGGADWDGLIANEIFLCERALIRRADVAFFQYDYLVSLVLF